MEMFTGVEYLKLDIANSFGLDKALFAERLAWVNRHLHELEDLWEQADEPMLYISGVMALRDAQAGMPIGHLVAFDACSSGLQLMAVMGGCLVTARNTGLVDPMVRSDIYTQCTQEMQQRVTLTPVDRKEVKQALMTRFYGSVANPKAIFGEDTPELAAFYAATQAVAPGPSDLMQDMLNAWQDGALEHRWTLPDGFVVHVKVMQQKLAKFEVDELNHATFSHIVYVNEGEKKGISLPANIVHSVDALVVREMNRRCNYDRAKVEKLQHAVSQELTARCVPVQDVSTQPFEQFLGTNVVLATRMDKLAGYSSEGLQRIYSRCCQLLRYEPFPIVCIHDSFKSHANDMNWVRLNYIEILAELADSTILQDILREITGTNGTLVKSTPDLSQYIRQSNYALS